MHKSLPAEYRSPAKLGGRLERFNYTAISPSGTGKILSKDALVYLPACYDDDPAREFNVFYCMHGGGGSSDEVFGGLEARSPMKNVIDNMIANNDTAPFIVVAPSFYNEESREFSLTKYFYRELLSDLMPKVEAAYRIKKSRECRAFGGFSMGSEATWNVFTHCLDEIKYYLPMSGDYWAVAMKGGVDFPKETAQILRENIEAQGHHGDFYVHAITGDGDIAYQPMTSFLGAVKEFHSDLFPDEVLTYTVVPGGVHSYDWCYEYIYNAIPIFFGK